MSRTTQAISWTVGLLACGGLSFVALRGAPPAPVSHDITMQAFEFVPSAVEARPGDTLRWTNRDLVPHTVAAQDGAWTSEVVEPGATWSLEVTDGMTTDYLCTLHPIMTGAVAIQ